MSAWYAIPLVDATGAVYIGSNYNNPFTFVVPRFYALPTVGTLSWSFVMPYGMGLFSSACIDPAGRVIFGEVR